MPDNFSLHHCSYAAGAAGRSIAGLVGKADEGGASSYYRGRILLAAVCAVLFAGPLAAADDPVPAAETRQLAVEQTQLAERYRKVEELLLRLADVEANENPERAALLRRAARQSRDKFILDHLGTAASSLSSEEYQKALNEQKAAQQELTSLLKLLMTEDRPKRLREEKERVSRWIKDLKRIERSERGIRARTENGAELSEIEGEQKSITDRAREVEAELKEDQQESGETGESQQGESQQGESQQGESQQGESQQGESQQGESQQGESQQGESQQGESQQGESQQGESQQGESQQGESQQGESQQGQPPSGAQQPPQSQPATPKQAAQQALEEARKNMERAQEKLESAQREEAIEAQRGAEKELREAIERLERILRQLREEEMLRELARIESRLRKMAQMQTEVLDKTRELSETPAADRDRQIDIRAGNLAFEEKKIVLEADRAVLLLREEGSSVAFPEVVQQMRGDMVRVAERLTQTKIDAITQGIQEDILAALEEMIAALQQAQRDLEKQQQQQQQAGQQGEQPLVQPLAELKLIRTMQTRIKSTTERYGDMVPEDVAAPVDEDLMGLLQNLSTRQQKLYRITRDLLLRRNQ